MKRTDKMLAELRARYGNRKAVTVCFMNGVHRQLPFLEALQICAMDQSVIDATTEDETGTSLLRAIIDGDRDLSEFGEFGE